MSWNENSLEDLIKEVKRMNSQLRTLSNDVKKFALNQSLFNTSHFHTLNGSPPVPNPTVESALAEVSVSRDTSLITINNIENEIVKIERRQARLRQIYEQMERDIPEISKTISNIKPTN